MEALQIRKKGKELSTMDSQEEMYKERLEDREWNQGLSTQEILDKINDPSEYASRRRK
jgi:hypothetical protein